MKQKILFLFVLMVLFSNKMLSQPFVDLVSFNYQTFSSAYKDNPSWKNQTDDYLLNIFLPKEFKNGNALLFRINGEKMNSIITSDAGYSKSLSSVSLALGFQWMSKNKKWKTVLMGIPKLASDFKDPITADDWQYGGLLLENYTLNDRLKIKAGLYYNREAFGNFFVPLVGIDWKATERINFYGVLPTNYKVEYNVVKNKLYAGLNLKSLTRSFRLSEKQGLDYVRYDEMQLKLFADYFVYKKVLLFGEAGYSLGKNPLQYKSQTDDLSAMNPVYTPLKNYPIFTFGIAYRIRQDFDKKE